MHLDPSRHSWKVTQGEGRAEECPSAVPEHCGVLSVEGLVCVQACWLVHLSQRAVWLNSTWLCLRPEVKRLRIWMADGTCPLVASLAGDIN